MKLYEYNFNPIQKNVNLEIDSFSSELGDLLWKGNDFILINLLWKGKPSTLNKMRRIESEISKQFSTDAFQYNLELNRITLCKFEIINIHSQFVFEKCIRAVQKIYGYNPNLLLSNLSINNVQGLLETIYHLVDNTVQVNFEHLKMAIDQHSFEKVYFMDSDIESGSLRIIEMNPKN